VTLNEDLNNKFQSFKIKNVQIVNKLENSEREIYRIVLETENSSFNTRRVRFIPTNQKRIVSIKYTILGIRLMF
jgi:hypothetical protein